MLEFNLNGYTKEEQANAVMTFILNRAIVFNKQKYKRICADLPNTEKGCVLYNLLFLTASFYKIPIYTNKKFKKTKFWNKNKTIKLKNNYFYKKICKKEDTLCWNVEEIDKSIDVFYNIKEEYITNIAKLLYGWDN